jgi:hypothetical protein
MATTVQAVAMGAAVPPFTPHAISVSLPTWRDNIGYEEGEKRVRDSLVSGYPRFFIHLSIEKVCYGWPSNFAPLTDSAYSLLRLASEDLASVANAVSCVLRRNMQITAELFFWTNHRNQDLLLPFDLSNISFVRKVNMEMMMQVTAVSIMHDHHHRLAMPSFTSFYSLRKLCVLPSYSGSTPVWEYQAA